MKSDEILVEKIMEVGGILDYCPKQDGDPCDPKYEHADWPPECNQCILDWARKESEKEK